MGGEHVGAIDRVADEAGYIDPRERRDAVETGLFQFQQRPDLGIRIGFFPRFAGEDRRVILVATDTYRAVGVIDGGRAARAIVGHHLELEAPGGLVVADHLDAVGHGLVAQIKTVLEQHERTVGRVQRLGLDHGDGARRLEEVGMGRVAM